MSKLRLFTRLQRTNRERIKNDEYRTRVMYERTNDRIQDSGHRQGYCDKSKVECECPLYAWECLSAFNCMTQKISKKLNIGYSSQSSCFLLIFVYYFMRNPLIYYVNRYFLTPHPPADLPGIYTAPRE